MFKKLFSKKTPEREKIVRATRVALYPLQSIEFTRYDEPSKRTLIANLSKSGIGLLREPNDHWPANGSELKGNVLFNNVQYPLNIRIAHLSQAIVGCEVRSDISLFWKEFEQHFSLELKAASMSEVNPTILKEEDDGNPRLFRNSQGCELFLVEKDGSLLRFQFSFLGNYFEGTLGQRTKFGYLHSDDPKEKRKYASSSIVRLVSTTPPEIIDSARKFLANMPALNSERREALSKAIETGA
jgi:hypothetical protein